MLTVSRHLLASADLTCRDERTRDYCAERGITSTLNASTPGHTVTGATQLQNLTLGLGHTGLEQGITRALNANRPGVTVQETQSSLVCLLRGHPTLERSGHTVCERDYPST